MPDGCFFKNYQGDPDTPGKSLSISGGDTFNQVSYTKPEILRDTVEGFPFPVREII